MIRKIESSPSFRRFGTGIWNPRDHPMLHTKSRTKHLDIWLYIRSFVLDNSHRIAEKFFLPGKLWWMIDIESRQSARIEVFSICCRTSTVIIEILRIFVGLELNHRETIAESKKKSKKNYFPPNFLGRVILPSHSFLREIAFSAASCSAFFLLVPFP